MTKKYSLKYKQTFVIGDVIQTVQLRELWKQC